MRILVTTDDGVKSLGFLTLVYALRLRCKLTPEVKVIAVAPREDRSGCGSSAQLAGLLHLNYHALTELVSGAWCENEIVSLDGTPIDCIKYGLDVYQPDWVFAGLNFGANVGRNILTSGTVCAAAFAAQAGIPAVAISQDARAAAENGPYRACREIVAVVRELLGRRPPQGAFYNVNLPNADRKLLGTIGVSEAGVGGYLSVVTRQGSTVKFDYGWQTLSKPEKLLDQGYAVVQTFKPFESIGGWPGDRRCVEKPSRKASRSSRSSAGAAKRSGRG